jgi:hypothetical protein
MFAIFIGNPHGAGDEQEVCEMFGRTFFLGIAQDISDMDAHGKAKLAGNSHFQVTADAAAVSVVETVAPKRGPGRPRKVEADGPIEGEAE